MASDRSVVSLPAPAERLEFTGERFTPGTPGEIEHEHQHRYLFALQFCAGRDVLDVASGEGYGSALLSTAARSVVGVELAPEVVEHARRSYPLANLTFRMGSATKLPLDAASVDVVVSFETLEHFAEHDEFMAEVKRVLRPGGLLVLSSPVKGVYSPGNPNPFHVRELTRAELEALVGGAFRLAVYLSQTPVLGSALLPDDPCPPEVARTQLFWKREDGSFDAIAGGGPSPYLVVVASDGPLPPVKVGVLQDRPAVARIAGYLERARQEAEREKQETDRLRQVELDLSARLVAAEDQLRRRTSENQELQDLNAALNRSSRPRGLARLWDALRRRIAARRTSSGSTRGSRRAE